MQNFSKFLVNFAQNTILRGFRKIKVDKIATNFEKQDEIQTKSVELFFKECKFCSEPTNILKDKVALITGGTNSLGIKCIKEFLRSGVKAVMIADVNEDRGREAMAKLSEDFDSDKLAFIKADSTNIKLLRNAFHLTRKHFNQVDIVVNIANEIEYTPWTEQIEKNLKGLVRCTLLAYEYLDLQNGGSGGFIVNVVMTSSLDDNKTNPIAVGTKYYLTHFGKAMSNKYQEKTGVKIISAVSNTKQCSLSEEIIPEPNYQTDNGLTTHGKTLTEMLKLSEPGSVWIFQSLQTSPE